MHACKSRPHPNHAHPCMHALDSSTCSSHDQTQRALPTTLEERLTWQWTAWKSLCGAFVEFSSVYRPSLSREEAVARLCRSSVTDKSRRQVLYRVNVMGLTISNLFTKLFGKKNMRILMGTSQTCFLTL